MTRTRIELTRSSDGCGTLIVDVVIEADGTIRLGWFDFGPSADQSQGGEVEQDLRIAQGAHPSLCFALLKDRFPGDFDALAKLRALCANAEIPVNEPGWN